MGDQGRYLLSPDQDDLVAVDGMRGLFIVRKANGNGYDEAVIGREAQFLLKLRSLRPFKGMACQGDDHAAQAKAFNSQCDRLYGYAAVNSGIMRISGGNENDGRRVVENIKRGVIEAGAAKRRVEECRLLVRGSIDAFKKFRVLNNAEMPGLAVHRAGRLERRRQDSVQLFPAQLPGKVPAMAPSFLDRFQYLVTHEMSFLQTLLVEVFPTCYDDHKSGGVFVKEEAMMRLALDEARLAGNEVPIGALVEKDGQVIALAHNCRESAAAPFAHAEMLAMEAACTALNTRRLSGCTLYVTLEPCPMCAGAMIMAGLERCVFGAFDSLYGCCGSLYALPQDSHFSHRVQIIGGVLEEEAASLLRAFFAAHRDLR